MSFSQIESLKLKVLKFSFKDLNPIIKKIAGNVEEMKFKKELEGFFVVEFLKQNWEAQQSKKDDIIFLYLIAEIDGVLFRITLQFREGTKVEYLSGEVRYRCDGDWWIDAMLKCDGLKFQDKKELVFKEPKVFIDFFPKDLKKHKVDPNFQNMTINDVHSWALKLKISKEQAQLLVNQDIDGSALVHVTEESLLKIGMKLGSILKILNEIKSCYSS